VNAKCGQTTCQLDIFDFTINFGGGKKIFVFLENLLLNHLVVGSDVGLWQEFLEAAMEQTEKLQ
jgi:hypothetical protein